VGWQGALSNSEWGKGALAEVIGGETKKGIDTAKVTSGPMRLKC
jgi:hypothetical protein